MISSLLSAIVLGLLAFVIVKVVLLTLGVLKERLKMKLSQKASTIDKGAVIFIEELLKAAPEISLEDFGSDVEEKDVLILGVKQDASIEETVDIIRAESIDDDVVELMKKNGGLIKVATTG